MRSVNQNHHLYVANAAVTSNFDSANQYTIMPVVSGIGMSKDLYFMYKGRDGVTRSDLIPIDQISYIKRIPAAAQTTKLKKVTVTVDGGAIDSDTNLPIVGRDYVLNIEFRQFYGLSPEDTYVKTVAVRMTSAIATMAAFYAALEDELNASFSREVGADATSNPYLEFSSSANGLVITEKEQDWKLGKWEAESLMFEVFPSTIYDKDGVEITWGVVNNDFSNTTVGNGKRMADLEWFTFSERADFYHGMGYPNNFDFTPVVVPTQSYDALEIHYAYQGTCEDIQKSEKDITIIGSEATIGTLVTFIQSNTPITSIPVAEV